VTAYLLEGIVIRDSCPVSPAQINLLSLIGDNGRSADLESQAFKKLFRQIHKVIEIVVGPVELTGCEFRIMLRVQAFIAEAAVNLENPFKSAHQETFEIQLRSYTHVQIHIQSVVVRNEGFRRGAAGNGMHHGRFHFHEAFFLHKAAEFAHDEAALLENLSRPRIHDEVNIPLAVARLHVLEPVIFFGQGAHGTGNELQAAAGQREFACLGAEHGAREAHNVAHVELLEQLEHFAKAVPLGIALQAACLILNMEKDDLSEGAQGNYAPGKALHGFLLPLKLFGTEAVKPAENFGNGRFLPEIIGEQGYAAVQNVAGFHNPAFDHFIKDIMFRKTFKHRHEIRGVR